MARSIKAVRAAADEALKRRDNPTGRPCPEGQHWDVTLGQCVND